MFFSFKLFAVSKVNSTGTNEDVLMKELSTERTPHSNYENTEQLTESISQLLEPQEEMPEGAGIYHPVDSYLLMKRLSVGWKSVQESMSKLHNDTRGTKPNNIAIPSRG